MSRNTSNCPISILETGHFFLSIWPVKSIKYRGYVQLSSFFRKTHPTSKHPSTPIFHPTLFFNPTMANLPSLIPLYIYSIKVKIYIYKGLGAICVVFTGVMESLRVFEGWRG